MTAARRQRPRPGRPAARGPSPAVVQPVEHGRGPPDGTSPPIAGDAARGRARPARPARGPRHPPPPAGRPRGRPNARGPEGSTGRHELAELVLGEERVGLALGVVEGPATLPLERLDPGQERRAVGHARADFAHRGQRGTTGSRRGYFIALMTPPNGIVRKTPCASNATLTSELALRLISSEGRPMMTVIADTCGRHDTSAGCCSCESNAVRFGEHTRYLHSCRENFLLELAKHGLSKRDIVANVNFFMNVPIDPRGISPWSTAFRSPAATSICWPKWTCSAFFQQYVDC